MYIMPISAKKECNNASFTYNQTSYVTSEAYHALNRNGSDIYIVKSTSTLFYDLDTLAKRHSYHFVPEYPVSERKLAKPIDKSQKNVFGAKSEAIVQEFETKIKPKLKRLDSLKIISKKLKKKSLDDTMFSSEIFLRDNDYTHISDSFGKNNNTLKQKFWSYAKYQTQYTNPVPENKKCKRKDRGKRTEDPCPCQLFSYACPCTDKKSLTELARNSKSLTVADQITSTPNFPQQEDQNQRKLKKSECSSYNEDKPTDTNDIGFSKIYEMTAVCEESVPETKIISKCIESKDQNTTTVLKSKIKVESKPHKNSKQVTCPNCKETLEIVSTEDEDSLRTNNHINKQKNNISDDVDICIHDPPCELVPVCQILPAENTYCNNTNQKCVRRVSVTKHNPKTIRITKACRHHPPCIVVPSCQRANVIRNNCEFIPPCLHCPRCFNVPLCVPHAKNLNYDDVLNRKTDDMNHAQCTFSSPRKNTSAYQHEPINSNQTCEYLSELSPRFILGPRTPSFSPKLSPYREPNQLPCRCCKANKSCQFDCIDCKCTSCDKVNDYESADVIVYIRDVGCQFRSDNVATDSLLRSKTFSTSSDLASANAGKYHSHYHTLRYEDKFTNPVSGEEASMSTFTSSLEVDDHCPSHGTQARKHGGTGFVPQTTASPFVAFSAYKDPMLQYHQLISDEMSPVTSKTDSIDMPTYLTTLPGTTRRSFSKGKRKRIFSIRRRKNLKRNNTSKSCKVRNME